MYPETLTTDILQMVQWTILCIFHWTNDRLWIRTKRLSIKHTWFPRAQKVNVAASTWNQTDSRARSRAWLRLSFSNYLPLFWLCNLAGMESYSTCSACVSLDWKLSVWTLPLLSLHWEPFLNWINGTVMDLSHYWSSLSLNHRGAASFTHRSIHLYTIHYFLCTTTTPQVAYTWQLLNYHNVMDAERGGEITLINSN